MLFRKSYPSPLGELTMVSDGKALTALSFQGEKYEAAVVEESQTGDRDNQAVVIGKTKTNEQEADALEKEGAKAVFDCTERWLDSYFSGHNPDFTPPICLKGTSFQEDVWEILKRIPYGKVISYGEIARQIAEKRGLKRMSAQAVGGAVGRNSIAIIIPCHRVVGSNGSLTGYAGGLDKKTELLKIEGVLISFKLR